MLLSIPIELQMQVSLTFIIHLVNYISVYPDQLPTYNKVLDLVRPLVVRCSSGALDFVFHVGKNFHAGKLASQIFLASQKLSKILSQQLAKVGTTMEFEMR